MEVLKIENLSKKFGTQKVLDEISFSVKEGSIFGFIGQNGAGKTTTMRMILGLLKKDSGEILVLDEKVHFGETKTNRNIGYLPDVPEFYGYMSAKEYLGLCGEITDMPKDRIKERTDELLELVGLENNKKKIRSYSRGMKQRLGIAQALLNEPKLLICDEPTSALDPKGRKEILDILQKVKGKSTVIFSTHILSDVERICDEVAVLHGGKIVLQGTLSELRSKHRKEGLVIEFMTGKEKESFLIEEKMAGYRNEAKENGTGVILYGPNLEKMQLDVYEVLLRLKMAAVKIEVMEPTMENLFLEVVK